MKLQNNYKKPWESFIELLFSTSYVTFLKNNFKTLHFLIGFIGT